MTIQLSDQARSNLISAGHSQLSDAGIFKFVRNGQGDLTAIERIVAQVDRDSNGMVRAVATSAADGLILELYAEYEKQQARINLLDARLTAANEHFNKRDTFLSSGPQTFRGEWLLGETYRQNDVISWGGWLFCHFIRDDGERRWFPMLPDFATVIPKNGILKPYPSRELPTPEDHCPDVAGSAGDAEPE